MDDAGNICLEVRGQLCEANSLLLPLYGSRGSNTDMGQCLYPLSFLSFQQVLSSLCRELTVRHDRTRDAASDCIHTRPWEVDTVVYLYTKERLRGGTIECRESGSQSLNRLTPQPALPP